MNIRIQDDKKDGILDIQRKAYQDYLNNMDRYVLEVPKYMLNYYKWNFEEINKVVALNETDHKDSITETILYEMIRVAYFCIDRNGNYGWI